MPVKDSAQVPNVMFRPRMAKSAEPARTRKGSLPVFRTVLHVDPISPRQSNAPEELSLSDGPPVSFSFPPSAPIRSLMSRRMSRRSQQRQKMRNDAERIGFRMTRRGWRRSRRRTGSRSVFHAGSWTIPRTFRSPAWTFGTPSGSGRTLARALCQEVDVDLSRAAGTRRQPSGGCRGGIGPAALECGGIWRSRNRCRGVADPSQHQCHQRNEWLHRCDS